MAAHRYTTKDGKQCPGVTTVIGRFKESGGLLWWANRLAYEPYAEARALLQGVVAEQPNLAAIQALLARPLEAADHEKSAGRAADAGTVAHAMVEAHLKGESADAVCTAMNPAPDVKEKAENAFLAFLNWADQTKLSVVKTELSLVSELHRYGGTLDGCVVRLNGRLGISDWKSSNALYPDMLLQVAAYGMLWNENNPENPVAGGFEIVRFSKDLGDFEHRHFDDLSLEAEAFLMMRKLYEAMKAIEKRGQVTKERVMTEVTEARALAPAITQGAAVSIVPKTFDEAWRFAVLISKSGAAPTAFRGKPEDAMVAVMMGLEVGLSPMQAIQNIAVINGRPSLWGDAMVALCMVHPMWGGIEDSFDAVSFTSTVTVRRKGQQPTVRRYSRKDAESAKLWGKLGPWTSDPARMCFNRARAFALRDAFADALRGLSSAEEQRDVVEIVGSHRPVDATPKVVEDAQPDPVEIARRLIEPMETLADLGSVWAAERMQSLLKGCTAGQRAHIANIKEKRKAELLSPPESTGEDIPDSSKLVPPAASAAPAPKPASKTPALNLEAESLLKSLVACHEDGKDGFQWWDDHGETVKKLPKPMAQHIEKEHLRLFPTRD